MRITLSLFFSLSFLSVLSQNGSNSAQKSLPLTDSSLYMCVEDFFLISGLGLAVTGRITTGKVSVGQKVCIKGLQKDSITATVNIIEKSGSKPVTATAGDNVGLFFSSLKKEQLKRGMVITVDNFGTIKDTLEVEMKLLPNAKPVTNGSSIIVYMHCNDVYDCKAILPEGGTIKPGETKKMKIKTSVPVFVMPNLDIVLRNYGTTTGVGKLLSLTIGSKK